VRLVTGEGDLARRGFIETARAVRHLETLNSHDESDVAFLLDEASRTLEPDLALATLVELVGADASLTGAFAADRAYGRRVLAVLGGSVALGRELVRRPQDLEALTAAPDRQPAAELRAALLSAVEADPGDEAPVSRAGRAADELRYAYRRELVRIAARDLTTDDPLALLDDVAGELADLADAAMHTAVAIARSQVMGHERVRFAVVALGKTGAQELNYISDVDVLYVAEPALDASGEPLCTAGEAVDIGTRLAAAATRACADTTSAGSIWSVDAALRPEGRAGPLVRTLASMRAYYEKWAKNWEFQAMLKARPMAGDLALGQEFCDLIGPLVWGVGERAGFVPETQAMRARVISLIPPKEADREIKLGAGGLRDTEFTVQLLQLVHGRADERLRIRATLPALDALVAHGYVGRADGARLAEAYRFQRLLEHRVQLHKMRRTHLIPDDEAGLRRLARAIGCTEPREVVEDWRASARTVTRLHLRVFYSPLLEAVARIPSEAVRLTTGAAKTRLSALGYADADASLRHIRALSAGMSRPAEIQRQLLPAMLGWFAAGPNPDAGLLAFRQVSEALGETPWYLRALRDESAMAERMALILSTSRLAVTLLRRVPQQVELLASDETIVPRSLEEVRASMAAVAGRYAETEPAVEAVQAIRRRELLRLAMADLLGHVSREEVGRALTDLVDATVGTVLEIARREVPAAPPLAVIACGSWGASEMSYASDADGMFVIDDTDDPEVTRRAIAVVSRLRALLRLGGEDAALRFDADLRPEGKEGPLVRTLSAYRRYYGTWSATWEAQAMLRADAGTGDSELGRRFIEIVDPVRYPSGGLSAQQVHEIRRLKARVETERMPRGVDAKRHVKLGPGGLSDVEWTVQLLQLQHAHDIPSMRTPRTMDALRAAVADGLLEENDATALEAAWDMAGRIRNTSMLVRGKAGDTIPTDARETAQVAQALGYGRGGASHLLEDWGRTARRARGVVDRLFYGLDD
jgi:[glutamine synthetase] adenylyltransferase / [glutamine synthetase]-adenylyl-L-tyrosine phosphorylase